jgi:hypothetical protein
MNSYVACDGCSRYVRPSEPVCPFCGAVGRGRAAPPPGRPIHARLGLSLAYGGSALALVACNDPKAAAPEPTESQDSSTAAADAHAAGAPADALEAAILDSSTAAADALVADAPADALEAGVLDSSTAASDAGQLGAWLTSGTGEFVCGVPGLSLGPDGAALECNRATDWCFTNHGFVPTGCAPLTGACLDGGDCPPSAGALDWDPSLCDGGLRRCACVTAVCSGGYASGTCLDDDAGGVTISCGACYGAPPVRKTARREAASPRLRSASPRRAELRA